MCAANLLIVAIYFRLPAVWDENFLLNEERIRHNEILFHSMAFKNSAISLYYGYRFRKNSDSLRPLLNSVAPEQCDKLVNVSSLILSLFTGFTLSILPFIILFIFGGFGNGFMHAEATSYSCLYLFTIFQSYIFFNLIIIQMLKDNFHVALFLLVINHCLPFNPFNYSTGKDWLVHLNWIKYISVNYVMFGIYQMSQVELISQAGLCCETAQSSLCTEMNNDCLSKNISGSGFFLQQFQELSLVDKNVPDSAEDTLVKSFGILFSTYILHFIILIIFLLMKK